MPHGEEAVDHGHGAFRKMVLEAGREPARRDRVVDRAGHRRCGAGTGQRGRHRLRRAPLGMQPGVEHRPEDSARMVGGIAQGRVPQRGPVHLQGLIAPEPMAGGIGGRHGAAGLAPAAQHERDGRGKAGEGSGNQAGTQHRHESFACVHVDTSMQGFLKQPASWRRWPWRQASFPSSRTPGAARRPGGTTASTTHGRRPK